MRNMRNNKMNIGLIALSAMLATGCDDAAFLRETPETSYAWKSHATLTPLAKQNCPLWL